MDPSMLQSLPSTGNLQTLAPLAGEDLGDFLEHTQPAATPFSMDRIEAIAAFSDRLMKAPAFRKDPACIAAAFWMRRANLQHFLANHEARREAKPDLLWVPVGRVFHLAPSNVDTLFLYSWVIAFLCGNTNVVRLSRKMPASVQALLTALNECGVEHPVLATQNRFLTYEHDEAVSAVFSQWCSHRIVWGGNATVDAMRRVPLNPHASERSFASKFSSAIINSSNYLALNTREREQVASGFFNDFFSFDQAACSTPQVLFWVGTPEQGRAASKIFLDCLQDQAERKDYGVDPAQATHRINHAFDLAIRVDTRVDLSHPALVAIEVMNLCDLDKDICGGGFLRSFTVSEPENILPFLDQRDQTLTHFGFDETEVRAMGRLLATKGIDRLVPVGEALNFEPIWDGFDLVDDCLRRVSIRTGARSMASISGD